MNFRRGSKQPLTPTPRPSEWSLSLEIMCMYFILSGPHTSLRIFDHIHYNNCNIIFRKWGGGSKTVWNLSKIIRFGTAILPSSLAMLLEFGLNHFRGIQYKLGKHYFWKKATQPWELNLGLPPIQGEFSTIIVSIFSWSLEADNMHVCLTFESLLLNDVVGMTFCKGWFERPISCIVMIRLQNTKLDWARK